MMTWERIVSAALDLVYPRRCAGCGGEVDRPARHLCWACAATGGFIEAPYCERCGDPVDGVTGHAYTCGWCARERPDFVRARSAVRYRGPWRHAIHALKYEGQLCVAEDLADLLQAVWTTHFADRPLDAVTYVPLHARRERERTYNQARVLAQGLGRRLRRPLLTALRRLRDTGSQTELDAARRRENVRGAFAAVDADWLRGRHLLVIDDVMTTGATVGECARVLNGAGAASVCVATVARG